MHKEISKMTEVQKKTQKNVKPEPRKEKTMLVGNLGTVLITIYLILFSILLLYGILQFWPPTGDATASSSVTFFFWKCSTILAEVRLLLIVAMAGALGSLVHAFRSFYWYVGHRKLVRSWLWKYILLPFVGTTLALAFYLVIRGGFFSPQATLEQTQPYGFAALAVLVGMFSEQAVLKLKDVADTLLTKAKPGADAVPEEKEKS